MRVFHLIHQNFSEIIKLADRLIDKSWIETEDRENMIFLPLLQFAALTSEDVWAAAAVFEELRLLFPIRVRRDGGVGGGWKKKD